MEDLANIVFNALDELEGRMELAMQANGCREAWLQAEIMMHAKKKFAVDIWTNTEPVVPSSNGKSTGGRKHDLAAYDDNDNPVTVAELKIMSGNFLTKCMFGGGNGKWQPAALAAAQTPIIDLDELTDDEAEDWGLISDARRLRRHPASERLLVMVLLDLGEESTTQCQKLQDVMERVTFEPNRGERTKAYKGFVVRMWKLEPMLARISV